MGLALELDMPCVVFVKYEDGFVMAQVDHHGASSGVPVSQVYHPCGSFGLPRAPTVDDRGGRGASAQTVYVVDGNDRHVILLDDPRVAEKLPELPLGSWIAYGDTGRPALPRVVVNGETGDLTITVPIGEAATTNTVITVEASTGNVTIQHAGGAKLIVKGAEVIIGGDGAGFLSSATLTDARIQTIVTKVDAIASIVGVPAIGTLGSTATTVTKGL